MKIKVMVVFGTRPDAIKMAPVCHALKKDPALSLKILVTAQHRAMLDQVLDIFNIASDYDLNIMEESQTLFYITQETLKRMSTVLMKEKPQLILVHGDTTTAFAAALAAFYLKIPIGHVEAGLRTFDIHNPYPEEANRVLTDSLTTLFFAPTQTAKKNIISAHGQSPYLFVTGNTVIDAFKWAVKKPHQYTIPSLIRLEQEMDARRVRMILLTAHRRENFGKPLLDICNAIKKIAQKFPDVRIIYPVHLNPQVQKPVYHILKNIKNIILIPPVDYLTLAHCIRNSYAVVTDSGGLQEEAPSAGKPVLVLRKVTERPEAVDAGTVRIIGTDAEGVYTEIKNLLCNTRLYQTMSHAVNPYGDGHAAERILQGIQYWAGLIKHKPRDFKS